MPNTRIYWLHTLSPTHAGIGRGVGYIDLPIDRDGVTGWPIIRGSAFKGVWADHFRATKAAREKDPLLKAAFGIAGDDDNSNSGALMPTDAKVVCLPVRSFRGTFAWCTSPLCLQILRRTLELAGVKKELPPAPPPLAETDAHHSEKTALKEGDRIFLEDLDFNGKPCNAATAWGEKIAAWVFPDKDKDKDWRAVFQSRFVILPDTAFDFLCETATEVHTRVTIDDETKTVADKALWTEESLPTETILAGIIQCDRVFQKNGEKNIIESEILQKFATNDPDKPLTLQIGGKATVGRGQVRCVFTPLHGGAQ